tara:strand:+ start:1158 stop:1589 length:432 start_codon:yes stop_codon:yes gene_type:complete
MDYTKMDDLEESLDKYAQSKYIHDIRFNTLFETTPLHYQWYMFRLFEEFKSNQFNAPWDGQWLSAQQAHRLLIILYKKLPNVMTPISAAVMQYVIDWWNIRTVFGTKSVYTLFCGYPDMYPTTVPPNLGPRQRLTANDFALMS